MMELKKIYHKTSLQTQNRLQEIIDTLNLTSENLQSIADNKTKKRINTYIEEWKDKGLLKGYFGTLANSIYKRTRVKNNEILELFIYGAYIEEQNKLNQQELKIIKDDANYYYQQGQEEVNKTLPKKKIVSVIPDAIFLALLTMPNAKGYIWEDYKEAITKYNADQIYRQMTIDMQQQKEIDILNDVYQNLIKKQQSARLSINGDKISGDIDLTLIGINNKAKEEGIYSFDDKAKVKFVAVEDNVTTKMCKSLDGQMFNVHDWNEFERYSQTNGRITKYRCYGLIIGLNCPPIADNFHWCRSMIQYIAIYETDNVYKKKDNIILNAIKILTNKELKEINKKAMYENLNKMQKITKDFHILKELDIRYKVVEETDDSSMGIRPTDDGYYILEINKNIFDDKIKQRYALSESIKFHPTGTSYKDIGTHEIGHIVNVEIIKKINNGNVKAMRFDYDNNITANKIVEEAFNNLKVYDTINKEKLVRDISTYSLDSNAETIAEAFADYYCNYENAKTLSKEIVKVMKGMI